MTTSRMPRGRAQAMPHPQGMPFQVDEESLYRAPSLGDWLLLLFVTAVLLGNGLYVWNQMGMASATGRAVFFGIALLCLAWFAIIYTLKLSMGVRVGPHGLSVVRGPWRTELAWREVTRLVQRREAANGRTYRWMVALARDGRQLQVREDMVGDYLAFCREVAERFRMWQDHGGTWGTTGGGPYSAHDLVGTEATWWALGAAVLVFPGLYCWLILPGAALLGVPLLLGTLTCAALAVRALLRRQHYTVDAAAITVGRPLRRQRVLAWRNITRVDRQRHPFGGLMEAGVSAGRVLLRLAARSDARLRCFEWAPRVPEYLILRGAGRHVRIRLHRLARPDELLAWVEFYERLGRRAGTRTRTTTAPVRPEAAFMPDDLHVAAPSESAPADPWAAEPAESFLLDGTFSDLEAAASAPEPVAAEQPPMPRTTMPPAPAEPAVTYEVPPAAAWAPPAPEAPPPPQRHQTAPPLWPEVVPPTAPAPEEPLPTVAVQPPDDAEDAFPDEVVGEDVPTDSIESLADSFAPWREDGWQRPMLPRFGPGPTPGTSDDSQR